MSNGEVTVAYSLPFDILLFLVGYSAVQTTLPKFTWIARSLLKTAANMAIPCSVKTEGRYLRPPRLSFEITNCDLKTKRLNTIEHMLAFQNRRLKGVVLILPDFR